MSSENSQGYLWLPCEFYSSLANQIMCNKQSALEYRIHVELTLEHIFSIQELELHVLLFYQNHNPVHIENIVWIEKCDILNNCLLKVQ